MTQNKYIDKLRDVAAKSVFTVLAVLCGMEKMVVRVIHAFVKNSPFRHRHILTRHNNLRWRFRLPVLCGMVFCLLMAAGSVTSAIASYMRGITMPDMTLTVANDAEALSPEQQLAMGQKRLGRYQGEPQNIESLVDDQIRRNGSGNSRKRQVLEANLTSSPRAPEPRKELITIGNGDTLAGVLQQSGASAREAYLLTEAMKDHFDPRKIRPGHKIAVRFDPLDDEKYDLSEMQIIVDPVKSVALRKDDKGQFKAAIVEKELETCLQAGDAKIEISLYGSAAKAGVPASVIAETIHIYSWDVDFQRDIRQGDTIEVLYEEMQTKDGEFVKNGNIVYARLNVNGQDIPVYRYEMEDGSIDYFTSDGKSVRKALMKTPINGARLSSGYGRRKHPVLGYGKMHKGLDFAAPTGTPIYAAGDGTIERIGRWSSYGNYIRIRHNSSIKTAYAHLNGFKKGLSAGGRVKQGEVIGYVGTTGRSTGPHLHYEVLKNGAQVNPRSIDLPQGEELEGQELANFKAHVAAVDRDYKDVVNGRKYAMRDEDADETEHYN